MTALDFSHLRDESSHFVLPISDGDMVDGDGDGWSHDMPEKNHPRL